MSGELKPCPFCGGTDSVDNAVQEPCIANRQVKTPIGRRGFEVQCRCGAVGPRSLDYHDAAALWNDRHSPPSEIGWRQRQGGSEA